MPRHILLISRSRKVPSAQMRCLRVVYILPSPFKECSGMGTISDPINNPSEPSERMRRRQERIYEPFPVTIRSVDASGETFELQTVLDNFSASNFGVRLARHVKRGAKVFAIVRMSTSLLEFPAPRVAVRGVVLGAEPQGDGTWSIAINFTRHRFL
jgi:hypothetical protein